MINNTEHENQSHDFNNKSQNTHTHTHTHTHTYIYTYTYLHLYTCIWARVTLFRSTLQTRNRYVSDSPTCAVCAVAQLCLTLFNPMDYAHQAPLAMGFSRQGYWRGLPFPPPGNLPNPGIKPGFPVLQADSLPLSHQKSPWFAYATC